MAPGIREAGGAKTGPLDVKGEFILDVVGVGPDDRPEREKDVSGKLAVAAAKVGS